MQYFYLRLALLAWLLRLALGAGAQTSAGFTQVVPVNPLGEGSSIQASAVATDAAGNQYVAGTYRGAARLGDLLLTISGSNFVAKRSGSTGAWLWVAQVADGGSPISLTVDGDAVYLASNFSSSTFATQPTATTLTSAGNTDIYVARFSASTGVCEWARSAGGAGYDTAYALTSDGAGGVYVTGTVAAGSSVRFGPEPTAPVVNAVGSLDAFVARYEGATGTCTWAQAIGGSSEDQGTGLAADSRGHVYVTGTFYSGTNVSFPTVPTTTLAGAGGKDIFLASFTTATGTCDWVKAVGGTSTDVSSALVADGNGSLFMTGYFTSRTNVTFPSQPTATVLTGAGGDDWFVARFEQAQGTCTWAKSAGGTGEDHSSALAVGRGSLYVGGYFTSKTNTSFPTQPTATVLAGAGNSDIATARYNVATGACEWAKSAGGTSRDEALGLATDGRGTVYTAGFFIATSTFVTPGDAAAASQGMFEVAQAAATGAWQAPQLAVTGGYSGISGITTDAGGNQYVTGYFKGVMQLGATVLVSAGQQDVFVAKRSADTGAWLWAVRAGGSSYDSGESIAVDGSGGVYVTGSATSATGATFPTEPAVTTLAGAGDSDLFVARFSASTGVCTWVRVAGGKASDVGRGVAVVGRAVFVTGTVGPAASFPTQPTATVLTGAGGSDILVARFNADTGTCEWAKAASSPGNENSLAIAVDASAAVYITGRYATNYYAPLTFNTGANAKQLFSTGMFIARFNGATGVCDWAKDAGALAGNGIAVDNKGHAFVTGSFAAGSAVYFPTTPATTLKGEGTANEDLYFACYTTSTGACEWVKSIGSSSKSNGVFGSEVGLGIATDAAGYIYVTGYIGGNTTLATTPTPTTLTCGVIDGGQVMLARFTSTGACDWAKSGGSQLTDGGYAVAVDGTGLAYVAGNMYSMATLGSFSTPSTLTSDATGFLASVQSPPIITALATAAELPGMPVTLSGQGFGPASTVSFSGTPAAAVTYTYPSTLTATVPAGATSGPVTVTTGAGASVGMDFTVLRVYDGGSPGDCTAAVPATATVGDGAWHYLLSSSGQVVLAYKYSGASLGTFAADVVRTDPAAAVRQDARGAYYLDRNWHLTASGGRFDGRSVALRFFGRPDEYTRLQAADPAGASSLAALRLSQYSAASEDCDPLNNDAAGELRQPTTTPLALDATAVGWFALEATIADHFSEFALSSQGAAPLPVQLAGFVAAPQGPAAVRLTWLTASELNSARFEIERSLDGVVFQKVGAVTAAGSSSTARSYQFVDTAPAAGATQLYYRLRQVDADGKATYSPVRSVARAGAGLALFPNPATGRATLAGASANANVTVFDTLGRLLFTTTASPTGTAELLLPAGLPSGVYLVRAGSAFTRLAVK
jgi:hypothetical protein